MGMGEWKEYKLGEIADITPGFAFKSVDFGQKGEKVVKIKDIIPPIINLTDCEHVDLEKYDKSKLRRFLIKQNDFVVAMTGATIGKIGKLKVDGHAYINQRVAKIDAKEGFCADFVYYALCGDSFQLFVQNNIDSNSAQENISANSLGRFSIFLPSFTEQKRIASVLRSLDDKIDLLHQENKTLEAMAEVLFRQWFIEDAKEGWKEKTLYDCISLVGGGTPKTSNKTYWNGNICWISCGDISNNHKGYIIETDKNITLEGLNNSSTKLLPENAFVISARGTVGKYCLLSKPMAFSQSNYGVLPKEHECYFFTYLLVSYCVDELQSAAYGSVFDTITINTFKGINIFIPSVKEIITFENRIKDFFEKIKLNTKQIKELKTMKELLLLRLISNKNV